MKIGIKPQKKKKDDVTTEFPSLDKPSSFSSVRMGQCVKELGMNMPLDGIYCVLKTILE